MSSLVFLFVITWLIDVFVMALLDYDVPVHARRLVSVLDLLRRQTRQLVLHIEQFFIFVGPRFSSLAEKDNPDKSVKE